MWDHIIFFGSTFLSRSHDHFEICTKKCKQVGFKICCTYGVGVLAMSLFSKRNHAPNLDDFYCCLCMYDLKQTNISVTSHCCFFIILIVFNTFCYLKSDKSRCKLVNFLPRQLGCCK